MHIMKYDHIHPYFSPPTLPMCPQTCNFSNLIFDNPPSTISAVYMCMGVGHPPEHEKPTVGASSKENDRPFSQQVSAAIYPH